MEKWKKQLRRIPRNSRDRIFAALQLLFVRDFSRIDRLQLKGYEHIYRIRVGDYRIVYRDDGERIILMAILRRDDNTYNAF